jgi:hypothetical protein
LDQTKVSELTKVSKAISDLLSARAIERCPLPYTRHSLKEIRNGTRPYLLGGPRRPKQREGYEDHMQLCEVEKADFAHGCGPDKVVLLIKMLLDSGEPTQPSSPPYIVVYRPEAKPLQAHQLAVGT